MNKIPNDQYVTDEAGLFEHAQFVIKPLAQLIVYLRALAVALLQTFVTKLVQITLPRLAFRHRVFGIFRLPELDRHIAAFTDRQCVANCLRKVLE